MSTKSSTSTVTAKAAARTNRIGSVSPPPPPKPVKKPVQAAAPAVLGWGTPLPHPVRLTEAHLQSSKRKVDDISSASSGSSITSSEDEEEKNKEESSEDEEVPLKRQRVEKPVVRISQADYQLEELKRQAANAIAAGPKDETMQDLEGKVDRAIVTCEFDLPLQLRHQALAILQKEVDELVQYVRPLVKSHSPSALDALLVAEEDAGVQSTGRTVLVEDPSQDEVVEVAPPAKPTKVASDKSTSEDEGEQAIPPKVTAKTLHLTDSQSEDQLVNIQLGFYKDARKALIEKKGSAGKQRSKLNNALQRIRERTAPDNWSVVRAKKLAGAVSGSATPSAASAPAAPAPAAPAPAKKQLVTFDLEYLQTSVKMGTKIPHANATAEQVKRVEKGIAKSLQTVDNVDRYSEVQEAMGNLRGLQMMHIMKCRKEGKPQKEINAELAKMDAELRATLIQKINAAYPPFDLAE